MAHPMTTLTFIIDPKTRTITPKEFETYPTLKDLQAIVTGYIELAVLFDNEDCIYVDEEGAYTDEQHFFAVTGSPHYFINTAILVGLEDEEGRILAATTTLEELQALIRWVDQAEVDRIEGENI